MARLSKLRVDTNKVVNGVWVKYREDIEFLVARNPNPKFNAKLDELFYPHLASIRAKTFDSKLDEALTLEAVCEFILLDWKGLEDDNDKPIKYSKEKAMEIMGNEEYQDIYKFILLMSKSSALYRYQEVEAASKN